MMLWERWADAVIGGGGFIVGSIVAYQLAKRSELLVVGWVSGGLILFAQFLYLSGVRQLNGNLWVPSALQAAVLAFLFAWSGRKRARKQRKKAEASTQAKAPLPILDGKGAVTTTLAECFNFEEAKRLWHERMQSPSRELPPKRQERYLELTPLGTKAIITPGVEHYLLFPDGSKFSIDF